MEATIGIKIHYTTKFTTNISGNYISNFLHDKFHIGN